MRQAAWAVVVGGIGLLWIGCAHDEPTTGATDAPIPGLALATEAYAAYQHADCETVYALSEPDRLDAMQATEVRYGLRLARGFCQEIDRDAAAARETYRRAIQEEATSFASEDARERICILDRLGNDPDYARRVERAANGPRSGGTPREPMSREPAIYPPLARASGVDGFVVIEFGIDRDGHTSDPLVVDSEPPFLFDGAGLRAVRNWTYRPQRTADTDVRHVIRIVFRTELEPEMVEEPANTVQPAPTSP